MEEKKSKWREDGGRGRKRKEEQGRARKKKDVRLRWCTRAPPPPLRFQIPSEFLQPFIGFSNIGLVFLILLVFSNLFPQFLVFSPHFWFPALLFVPLFAVSLPFPCPTLMVDPTLRLCLSSLVGFLHHFSFSRLPFGCSNILLFTSLFVWFSALLFSTSPWFLAPSYVFNGLLFALSASLFAFSIVWFFLTIPLCFSRPSGVAPFLVFVLALLVSPITCRFLLHHSICFVALFGFLPPPFQFPSLPLSGPHLPLPSRTR